jgi:hypothetical protein
VALVDFAEHKFEHVLQLGWKFLNPAPKVIDLVVVRETGEQ